MNQKGTSEPEEDEALVEVRSRNRRYLIRLTFAVCLVLAIGLSIRLGSYLTSRPPKVPSPLKSIPGYYTEKQVMAFITNGIPMTAVIAKFGQPSSTLPDREGFTRYFWEFPTEGCRPLRDTFFGFSVKETNGVVFWKGSAYVTAR